MLAAIMVLKRSSRAGGAVLWGIAPPFYKNGTVERKPCRSQTEGAGAVWLGKAFHDSVADPGINDRGRSICCALAASRHRESGRAGGSDIEVYRDQLDEIERDRTAGLVGGIEAEEARVEISRRLLAAANVDRAAAPPCNDVSAARRRRIAAITSLALPVIAGGLYLWLGSPDLAFEPSIAQTAAGAEEPVESLVAKTEQYLQLHPNDGRAWEVLAPVYMRLDRYSDSVTAWRNVLRILGESAERDANLGEALTAEANGVVTAEANAAFVRARALDSTLVTARYYLGVAAQQDGRPEEATKIWRDLIAEAPPGATWVSDVRNALARVEGNSAQPPGPSAAQMAAAANQPPDQQAAIIQGMVDRLATRLKQDGSDVNGWVRLVNSYKVLGEPDKARAAIADAKQALASDPGKLEQLDAALKTPDKENAAAAAPVPGPSAAQMVAAADQPPDQQTAMIQGMVDRLAARLKQDGSDVNGWVQLVNSYKVLGDPDKARAAIADAKQALASDPSKLEQFDAALKGANTNPAAASTFDADKATPMAPVGLPADHQQAATMQDMVNRLAERLKTSGSDPAGWLMLVRSYVTLGEKDKATAAISDARQALASDPATLDQFNAALKSVIGD